tara:strand:- start:148 stop:654 length:507 start_codon:yes stop_codon:yes gene_type:complete
MKVQLNAITEYQDKQCGLFAKYSASSSTDEYARRSQFNKDKIVKDIYNGKKAEFLVYNFLISQERKLNSPDLNIYGKHNKSYDSDLILVNIKIHVKSHEVNHKFPVSWVFQKTDPLLKVEENNYLALVVLNKDTNYMYLKEIAEVHFRPPVKQQLRKTKLCLYESDIQ